MDTDKILGSAIGAYFALRVNEYNHATHKKLNQEEYEAYLKRKKIRVIA